MNPTSWRQQFSVPGPGPYALGHSVLCMPRNAGDALPPTAAGRQRGIVSTVDVAQSAGVMPIDVEAMGADVVLKSCVKWLCGGPGAGFLWVRSSLVETLLRRDVGWFSHANPFEFDPDHFEYAADALRFWGGTPSIAPFIIATSALRILCQIGVDELWSQNGRLQTLLADCIACRGNFNWTHLAKGATSCIPLGARRAAVESALRERNVRCDFRGDTLRVSFHIYNTESDMQGIASAMNAAVWGQA